MKLVIVESPSKAKTIEKYLGKEYVVRASVGHVRDLPTSNKKAIDIPGGFVPHYEISKGKDSVIAELKQIAKKADEVILAPDPDREGEAIAWHIEQALDLKKMKKPFYRVVFHEITEGAIKEAMQHPRAIDQNLKSAQEARRVLDRLFGYDLSGLIWKKVRYGLSAGRVQSPALRILAEREREIQAFIPTPYWVISGLFKTVKGDTIKLTATEEPTTEDRAIEIAQLAKTGAWTITDIKESEQKRNPRAPFTTSTLQQTASSRLGYSPSRTMQMAQKLYEAGHITYMRTDSTNLAAVAQAAILKVVEKQYGKNYVQANVYAKKSKNAQEAHEAIRPTRPEVLDAGVTEEQKKVYRLIWERAISSQMVPALTLKTKIVGHTGNEKLPEFTANGSRILFPGWLACDTRARGEDVELPEMKKGDALKLEDLESLYKETTPPNRYTEAGLIKELEERGIGRPSTYASIIRTLEEREYVTKEGRTLFPTDTGMVVSGFVEENFKDYISDTFTAEMENELDEIATGERTYLTTLSEFYGPFLKEVQSKENSAKITNLGAAPDEFKCPKCAADMVIKLGRGGRFLSCGTYPDCDGARAIDGSIIDKDKPIGDDPVTGKPIKMLVGRFGPYVQIGDDEGKGKTKVKARKASIPKDVNPEDVTLEMALHYLALPRDLGVHPETGAKIIANTGRFGPYIAYMTQPKPDFRSIKAPDDVYTIELPRALAILSEEKKKRGFVRKTAAKKTATKRVAKKSARKKIA